MTLDSPKIDERTATDIAEQAQLLTASFTGYDLDPRAGLHAALTGVFSRYAELIIERLNKVPGKNFLSFLDLIGASQLAPQPARAPLTFMLAAGSTVDAIVPRGTQAAAQPAEGETEPVIFETEQELVVTAAELKHLFVLDPEQDKYADFSSILTLAQTPGIAIFEGNRPIERILYIGHDKLFSYPNLGKIILKFFLTNTSAQPDAQELQWEIWNGQQWVPINESSDTTGNLTGNGEAGFGSFTFDKNSLAGHTPLLQQTVGPQQSRWLRCRLQTPITPAEQKREGMTRAIQLPFISNIKVQVQLDNQNQPQPLDTAFYNLLPLDTTKDFFPFGERPRFGDTLYLANHEALSKGGANITFHVRLANPVSGVANPPIPPVYVANNPALRWEYWNGKTWRELGTSKSTQITSSGKPSATCNITREGSDSPLLTADNTCAFTTHVDNTAQAQSVTFKLPEDAASAIVNGIENYWVRIRLVSGNYGDDVRYTPVMEGGKITGYTQTNATLSPPAISSITVDYNLTTSETSPDAVLTYNDFIYTEVTNQPFRSFETRSTKDSKPSLSLGFALPPPRTMFPNINISLFADVLDVKYGETFGKVWPTRSKLIDAPASVVTHKFLITNTGTQATSFSLSVYGYKAEWPASLDQKFSTLNLEAGQSTEVKVSVSIPADASPGSHDSGFIKVVDAGESAFEYGAIFTTSVAGDGSADDHPHLAWYYWNGNDWATLVVQDETKDFSLPGLIEFLGPADAAHHEEFGVDRYWLRVSWESGEYAFIPRLRRFLLNTMMASQVETVLDEILGSSDGSMNQKFHTTRAPVLDGEQLLVREIEMPSAAEQEKIISEEGADALPDMSGNTGPIKDVWIRWHRVPDFYSSGPRDRHYVLDQLSGEIRFGDGLSGLIPPLGSGNIRLALYRTGGGVAGNRAANTITQLKTTIPYVDRVTNFLAADGGTGGESLDSLIERAPRTLRHQNRAVTLEDYEDLAKLASPGVALAKCIPLYDLELDPAATVRQLGTTSLIIVPATSDPKPAPGLQLVERVRSYIEERRMPAGKLAIVGPEYIRIDVEAEVSLETLEGASGIEAEIIEKLTAYLHPLTGGTNGLGWSFGSKPYRSDFYALLESIKGVDHVNLLNITETPERPGLDNADPFLIYSGTHTISLTFESA